MTNVHGVEGISIVVDCAQPRQLAEFWQAMVGGVIVEETASEDWVAIEGMAQFDYLGFQQVPEAKTSKNRTHIDVMVGNVEASREYACALGATVVGAVVEQQIFRFQVMTDPEDNEFCLVQRKAQSESFRA